MTYPPIIGAFTPPVTVTVTAPIGVIGVNALEFGIYTDVTDTAIEHAGIDVIAMARQNNYSQLTRHAFQAGYPLIVDYRITVEVLGVVEGINPDNGESYSYVDIVPEDNPTRFGRRVRSTIIAVDPTKEA